MIRPSLQPIVTNTAGYLISKPYLFNLSQIIYQNNNWVARSKVVQWHKMNVRKIFICQ